MGLPDLYPAQVGSPYTTLAAPYTTGEATMTVVDATKLPDAPNIVCLAGDVAGEFKYTGKDGNILQGVVALPGTPVATTWPAGTFAFRGIAAYDLDALREYAWRTVSDLKLYTSLRGIVPNRDTVLAGGYRAIPTTSTPNLGSDAVNARYFLNRQQDTRIRQTGVLTQVQMYLDAIPPALTAFYIQIWRRNPDGTYNRISSEDVLPSLADGMNTITLATPVAVVEGDFVGYGYTGDSPADFFMQTLSGTSALRYTNTEPRETGYAWDSQLKLNAFYQIRTYVSPGPLVVCIGDSIMMGAPAHTSYCVDAAMESAPHTTIPYFLGMRLNAAYQNMGIGSETTTLIAARFAADVVALKPKIAIIEGGVNDIAGGTITQATYLANWATMLDACAAADIIPVCLAILPWTNGTDEQLRTRDTWNAALRDLVLRYGGAVWVDASPYVGQYRTGGDDNNLWDIQTAYNADGVHYNTAGHAQIARAIADAIEREYGGIANEIRILPHNYVADVSFGGDILDGQTAGEVLAQLDVVYLKSDGKWWKAKADAEATGAGLLGIAMQAASADGKLQILIRGTVRNDTWAWTVGGSLYLSTDAGALTQTAPSGSTDIVRLAGVAYSADVIAFTPDLHYSVVT